MLKNRRAIFREHALQYYAQSCDRDVLPHFISPPVFWLMWTLAAFCLIGVWIAGTIQIPILVSSTGLITTDRHPGEARAILFVPADQKNAIHSGAAVQLRIGASSSAQLYRVTEVVPGVFSPQSARQHYRLDGPNAPLVAEPVIVAVVALDSRMRAANYEGSVVHAQIQTGEKNLLSFPFQ